MPEGAKLQIQEIINTEGLESISIEISAKLYIGHIENFSNALYKLADVVNSPLSSDGYTGIQIFEPSYDEDEVRFLLHIYYLITMPENKKIFVNFLLNEGINKDDINFILDQCIKLDKLDVELIALVDSHDNKVLREQTEERFRKSTKI